MNIILYLLYLLLRLFCIFWENTAHKCSECVYVWTLKTAFELRKIWDFHRCAGRVSVFWDMTSTLDFPEDGGSKLLWNFHTCVPNYMASSQKIGIFDFELICCLSWKFVSILWYWRPSFLLISLIFCLQNEYDSHGATFVLCYSLCEYVIWCRVFFF